MVKQQLMAQCVFGVVLTAGVLCLAGCETLKSTISGPFIGLEKDMQNAGKAIDSVCKPDPATGKSKLDNADAWVQKNLW